MVACGSAAPAESAELGVASSVRPADVAGLYAELSRRLEQIVRVCVHAPEPVVEDSCQFAWHRLVRDRARIRRDTVLSWLVRTAVREAIRLLGREHRCVSLDAAASAAGDGALLRARSAGPEELVMQRERLALVGVLPSRQRQMMWLHAIGLSYEEIAARTGCTVRTVERQLLRAKRAVREAYGAELT